LSSPKAKQSQKQLTHFKKFGKDLEVPSGFRPDDFRTREEFLQKRKVKIPFSTAFTHIVPPIFDGWGFLTNRYDTTFFIGLDKVEKQDYEAMIRDLNHSIQVAYRKRRDIRYGFGQEASTYLLIIGLLFAFSGFITLESKITTGFQDDWADNLGFGLFGISFLVVVYMVALTFCLTEHKNLSEKDIFEQISTKILKYNIWLGKKGYELRTQKRFFWLEIRKLHERIEGEIAERSSSQNLDLVDKND